MSSTLYPPPSGVKSDWSNEGWAPAIEGLCIALLVLTTLFVVARLYTRVYVLRNFGIDDWFCIIAYGLSTTLIAWQFVAIHYGFGRHIWDIPKENAKPLYKAFFLMRLLPGPVYLFIKVTLLMTYSRIFQTAKYMRWLIWGGIFIVAGFYIGTFFNTMFSCRPVAKGWNPFLKGKCAKEKIPGAPTGIFNVISDLYIVLLPFPMVWKLNMSWNRKVKLLSLFSLGFFTIAMSAARFAETVIENGEVDFTYHYGITDVFTVLEFTVGLMVACILVLPVLWDQVLRKPFDNYLTRVSSAYQSILTLRSDRSVNRNDSGANMTEVQKTNSSDPEYGSLKTSEV